MRKENIKLFGQIIAITLIIGIIGSAYWNMTFSSLSLNIPGTLKSTHAREKIIGNTEYKYDCIVDESGFIENVRKDKVLLKKFFDMYGIQPYLVIKKMKNSDVSEDEKKSYAEEWYSRNIKDENSFLLMYSYVNNSDVGYFTYAAGKNAENVMDDEAADILISMIQKKLFLKNTPENVIVNAFAEVHYYINYPAVTMERYLKAMAVVSLAVLLTFAVVGGTYFLISTMTSKKNIKFT